MNSGKAILSILAAAAAGTAVGILFAPDSGTNTRKKISKKGNNYAGDLKGTFSAFLDTLTEKLESVKEGTNGLVEMGKSKTHELKREIHNAATSVEQK